MDQSIQDIVQKILDLLITPICGEYKAEFVREGEQWRINLTGENTKNLLGFKGEVLNSVQHLVRVLVHQRLPKDRTHFILDVDMSRSRREKFINEEIPNMAKLEVLAQGMTIIIKNLSSYERRLIHQMLQEVEGLETMSVGEGNNRKLLIRPTSDTGSLGIDNSKIVDISAIEDIHLD
jgi:spoIIIJ-associated protein